MTTTVDTWICPLGLVHRVFRWATVCGNSFYRGPTQRVRSERRVTCLRCIANEASAFAQYNEALFEIDNDE